MNIVIIKGNLTRDPEIRFAPSGVAITSFSVAVNRVWKDADGEKKEDVSFINCTAFNGRAETIDKYFRQGDEIIVEGYLKQESWEDKESGDKRSALKVIVDNFHFTRGGTGDGKKKSKRDDDNDRDRDDKPKGKRVNKGRKADVEDRKRDKPAEDEDDVPFMTWLGEAFNNYVGIVKRFAYGI